MTDEQENADTKTIRLRYKMVDGVMRIDVDSRGFEDDPNMIAMYLSFTLDRLLNQGNPDPA